MRWCICKRGPKLHAVMSVNTNYIQSPATSLAAGQFSISRYCLSATGQDSGVCKLPHTNKSNRKTSNQQDCILYFVPPQVAAVSKEVFCYLLSFASLPINPIVLERTIG